MPNKNDVWYYCQTCNSYFQNEERMKECLKFSHRIKRRTPLRLRLGHQIKVDEPNFITLTIDGDKWNIFLRFAMFKTVGRTTEHLSNLILFPPLSNISKQLTQLLRLKITASQLKKLVEKAIVQGTYEERGRSFCTVYLTLNDWLLLKPKTNKSKLVTTTHSKFTRLVRDQQEILAQAIRTAKPFRVD